MHIALFGGAFDPPHNGHKLVASTLISKKIVDEVWFVPVYEHPWAKKLGKTHMTEYIHRHHMIKLLCNSHKLKVAEYRSVSYTYDTLAFFTQKFPQHHFSWVMGSEYLPKYDAFVAMHPGLANFTIYIYPRSGSPMSSLRENMIGLHDVSEIAVSSTQVRNLLLSHKSVTDLIPPAVNEYIHKHGLYENKLD